MKNDMLGNRKVITTQWWKISIFVLLSLLIAVSVYDILSIVKMPSVAKFVIAAGIAILLLNGVTRLRSRNRVFDDQRSDDQRDCKIDQASLLQWVVAFLVNSNSNTHNHDDCTDHRQLKSKQSQSGDHHKANQRPLHKNRVACLIDYDQQHLFPIVLFPASIALLLLLCAISVMIGGIAYQGGDTSLLRAMFHLTGVWVFLVLLRTRAYQFLFCALHDSRKKQDLCIASFILIAGGWMCSLHGVVCLGVWLSIPLVMTYCLAIACCTVLWWSFARCSRQRIERENNPNEKEITQ